jgi:RimJ/RimL family protein N-acetyltransferase
MAETTKAPVAVDVPMLIGSRIYLQPLSEAELPAMFPWWNDARTRRWARTTFPQTLEGSKKHVAELAEIGAKSSDFPFAIWSFEEKRPIGHVGLYGVDWVDRNAWLGLIIGEKSWWGQGIAGEVASLLFDFAFGELGIHKICTGVSSPNNRSLGATSKMLTRVGIAQEEGFVDGQYIDDNIFELFDRDWIRMRKQTES